MTVPARLPVGRGPAGQLPTEQFDLADAAEVTQLLRSVGSVDVLVNNAGGVTGQVGKSLEDVTDAEWRASGSRKSAGGKRG